MHNIICLKHGDKYDSDYVNKLYCGIKRNATIPFTFHCFTDNVDGLLNDAIISHPLPYENVEGWWQKLYLFSDEINIEGRVLFLDLDTLITGNIDHYITHNTGFVALRDLWAGADNVGSAIMSFEVGKHKQIWETFIRNPEHEMRSIHPHGDQKIIQKYQQQRTYWQDLFPNEIMSFKSNCLSGLPANAKIICYHGRPSIPESINTTTNVQRFVIPPTPWVKQYWRTDD